jgi:AraC family transcriptional regulator
MEHYRDGDMSSVPNQWQRFAPWLGHIPGQLPHVAFGVVLNGDDEGTTDYLTAMEVKDFADVPAELARLRLPPQRYAVFAYPGHIADIRSVWRTLWSDWVPNRIRRVADAPFFELYPEAFDPQSGEGGFEIWLPVES